MTLGKIKDQVRMNVVPKSKLKEKKWAAHVHANTNNRGAKLQILSKNQPNWQVVMDFTYTQMKKVKLQYVLPK